MTSRYDRGRTAGHDGVRLLRGAVRAYAWGSRTAIPSLLGTTVPAPHPQAELWLGAHPGAPSTLHNVPGDADEQAGSLLDLVRDDPVRQLGDGCAGRWGDRLPFLLKVLAAEEPLSLQAHPSAQQAAEGYAREESLGIPGDAAERNYRDPHHKPELVCALTEFHALAGFRSPPRTLDLLDALDVAQLAPYRALLAAQPDADGLRALFTTWITVPQTALDGLLPPLLAACVEVVRGHGPFATECRVLLELAEAHPGDVGVLAAMLLNHVVLAPGEALYLPAGNLHTYLHGIGVEIMASSDNVLRGGLTAKHVDVPELLRVLDFAHGDLVVHRGVADSGHETTYPTPADEFLLSRLDWAAHDRSPVALPHAGAQILLCTAGSATVCQPGAAPIEVARGATVWVPAHVDTVSIVAGDQGATVFRARTGSGDGPARRSPVRE